MQLDSDKLLIEECLNFLQHQILAHQTTGLLAFVVLFSIGNLIQIPGWIFLAAAVLTLGKTSGGLATVICPVFEPIGKGSVTLIPVTVVVVFGLLTVMVSRDFAPSRIGLVANAW